MKWIVILISIASVRLVESSGMKGLCGCEGIDPARYDSNEFGPQYRIHNGTIVHDNDLRWVVSLFVRYCGNATERASCESPKDYHYVQFCTGALLNRYHVITAGHVCTDH